MPPSTRPDDRFALFLDFDGTLVEIVERPDAVAVEPGLPSTLARLRDRLGGALALVSGRPIATLDGFLAPERFDAAGLHGVEQRVDGRMTAAGPGDHPELRAAVAAVTERIAGRPGLLVEDKGASFALHWRLAPDEEVFALGLAQEAAAGLGAGYRLQEGKLVAEILPAAAAKGAAIERFLARPPYEGRHPVFVGDDRTDEHGFLTVNARGGLSVRVGGGPTEAAAQVASPATLRAWLAQWAETGTSPLLDAAREDAAP